MCHRYLSCCNTSAVGPNRAHSAGSRTADRGRPPDQRRVQRSAPYRDATNAASTGATGPRNSAGNSSGPSTNPGCHSQRRRQVREQRAGRRTPEGRVRDHRRDPLAQRQPAVHLGLDVVVQAPPRLRARNRQAATHAAGDGAGRPSADPVARHRGQQRRPDPPERVRRAHHGRLGHAVAVTERGPRDIAGSSRR